MAQIPKFLLLPLLLMSTLPAQTANVTVVAGANFQPGLPRPGGIATLFLTGLLLERDVIADTLPLPESLAGVRVTVDGAPAALFAVLSLKGFQQINF